MAESTVFSDRRDRLGVSRKVLNAVDECGATSQKEPKLLTWQARCNASFDPASAGETGLLMSAFESKNRTFRHRNEINIVLRLASIADPVSAIVFASPGERASDLLNDSRQFIPVRLANGETMIVAKSQITSIMEQQTSGKKDENGKSTIYGEDFSSSSSKGSDQQKNFDPYVMLRVSPSASLDEIRAAYKARIKAVHPDRLASLGLDEDIAKAAVLATQKVNYAYQAIMREREERTSRAS